MKSTLFVLFICLNVQSNAQTILSGWTLQNPFPGGSRDDGSAFAVNGIGYFGCGIDQYYNLLNDWWRYNEGEDTWTELDSLPGIPRQYASILEFGNRAYMIGGATKNGVSNEVFQFSAESESWTKLENAPFPGLAAAASFTIADFGYILGGRDNERKLNSFWKFDSRDRSWHPLEEPPFEPKDEMSAFVISGSAYVLLGRNDSNDSYHSVYQYDPKIQSWSQVGDYPGRAASYCECINISDNQAVCAGGMSPDEQLLSESFLFDGVSENWSEIGELGAGEVRGMQSFIVGNSVFFLGGLKPFFTRTDAVQKIEVLSKYSEKYQLVKVCPNPSNDELRIALDEISDVKMTEFNLYNSNGQLVWNKQILPSWSFECSLKDQSIGLYSLQVILNDGRDIFKKLILF